MRYFNILQNYVIEIPYKDKIIRVPEPAAYTLHKFILSSRRKNQTKKQKDLYVAKEIGEFLLQREHERAKLISIYNDFPRGWQKTIKNILIRSCRNLYKLLEE